MRPLKIIFEGFETYCNKTEVDFSLLGKNGIYLITGKTGSGKTTIFDGICYALYGEASGTDRSEKMLRSVNADGSTPTYVDFTFENNGKVYNIRRNPEYMRKAKKGDSEAKEKSDAVLTLPDGKIISQQKNVNPAVVEILGLDKEQFVQIAMIAQGKFQKLLFSETKDRIELFRKIFKTELYELLQKRLRDDVIALNKKCRDVKLSISQYVSGIQCARENPDSVLVDRAKEGELPVEEICTVIEKLIQDGKAEKETLEKENRTVQKKLEEVKAELKKAEDFLNQQKLCEEKKEQLVQKEGQLKNLEAELKKEEEACAAVPKLEEELALKKEKLSSYAPSPPLPS